MLPKKHLSGAEKRKRKRLEEQFRESQRGALHKFFPTSSSAVPVSMPVPDDNVVDAPNIEEEEEGQQQVDDIPADALSHPEFFGFQNMIKIKNNSTIFS